MERVVAVDIGGTKIAAGVVDEQGQIVESVRCETPREAGAEEIWEALAGLLGSLREADNTVAVGIGTGGPMTRGGELVSPVNIRAWRGFPLRRRVRELCGLAVHVENDAKALALAEGWRGAASGVGDFMAMVVSTGIGGGIVLDGRLLDGAAGNAGHVGHVVVEPEGALMAEHAQGCLEAEASGLAIEARTGRPPAEADEEVKVRTGTLVGRAAGSVCNLLDLELVLVAGSVALGFGPPFFEAAQAEMDRICVLEFSRGATIRPAGLGADGPLVGAAAVAWRALGHDIGVA